MEHRSRPGVVGGVVGEMGVGDVWGGGAGACFFLMYDYDTHLLRQDE